MPTKDWKVKPTWTVKEKQMARTLVEMGHSFNEVARLFNTSDGTIAAWARKGDWITPQVKEKQAAMVALKNGELVNPLDGSATEMQLLMDEHRRLVLEKASKALREANLQPPDNWRDAKIADDMARRAGGADDTAPEANLININIMAHAAEVVREARGSVVDTKETPSPGEETG